MIAIPDMSTNNSSFVRSTDHQKQSIPEFNELLETQCKCFSFYVSQFHSLELKKTHHVATMRSYHLLLREGWLKFGMVEKTKVLDGQAGKALYSFWHF
jgi:hypothetical protein